MKIEKSSHLKDDAALKNDLKKRVELILPDDVGRVVSYQPYNSIQIIFFDVKGGEIPDMWKIGFRKGDSGRYLRTLICRRGGCDFTVNGVTSPLRAGQVMMDYSVGDDLKFNFVSEDFEGVEITMQVDTLVRESAVFRMLRLVIEAMYLPEEDIFDSDGYVFNYSGTTGQTLNKLLSDGFGGAEGIMIITHTVEIGHNLGTDLKHMTAAGRQKNSDRQRVIADDIYRCLTDDFGTRYTAAQFAEKYGISDTTVKKYFSAVYGYGFKEYQTKIRMEWAAKMLTTTDMRVGDISDRVGYSKQTKFTKAFKDYYHVTPMEYRRRSKIEDADRTQRNQGGENE